MSGKKKPTYRDHVAELAPILRSKGLPQGGAVVCLYGPSEYLLNHAVALLQERAEQCGALHTGVEAGAVNEQLATAMAEQGSLFEPATLYVVRRCEQAKSLQRFLKGLPPGGGGRNTLCFVYKGESPVAALKTELTRLEALFVSCFDPWPNEVPAVAQQMAQERGLTLKQDAVALLVDAVGTDLVKLDHELGKLALIFLARRGEPLAAADVAPHLGMIREDDAFQLDRLLLARQWAKAQALAEDLLDRGEKPLALLGILSNHCRNALRIATALRQGARAHELGAGLRLPPFLIKTYAQALAGADPRRYEQALLRCHEADVRLKSSPVSESLLIGTVLAAIQGDQGA